MKTFGKIILYTFLTLLMAAIVCGIFYKDWVVNAWNEIFHPQTSGAIVGNFKVIDSSEEPKIVFCFSITKDKFIVKKIDANLVSVTGSHEGVYIPSVPGTNIDSSIISSSDFVVDMEINLEEVFDKETNCINFSFAKGSEYEYLYGPYKLTPNYSEKTYSISSVEEHVQDLSNWQVVKITAKEFEELTASNE